MINDQYKKQAELLLRKPSAASGTMEALIKEVSDYLKDRNYLYFSLGEVPFMKNPGEQLPPKSLLMYKTGQFARFAYNSHSLYKFKNKFSPEWQSVYLCGYPKISLLTLIEMGIRSNYIKLIFSQLPKLIKNQ